MTPTTKKAQVAHYKEKLGTDARWALRGLMRVYAEQTESEKEYEVTAYTNGVGFTGVDADILTSFAKQYERRGSLSEKQMALLFKRMPKYAGQLLRLTAPKQTETVAA
jgi:hypothetical protein